MIDFRLAEASDADAIACLQTLSWRENDRGSFSDSLLDGELPEKRLRVWHGRPGAPASAHRS